MKLSKQAKKLRNQKQRKWYKENHESHKDYMRRYMQEYRKKHPGWSKKINERSLERQAEREAKSVKEQSETGNLSNETAISTGKPVKEKGETAKCLECETRFIPSRKDQKFCSQRCRLRHHRNKK